MLIDIASSSISSGNQRLLILALELLYRSFVSKKNIDPADLLDTQDIVTEVRHVIFEYRVLLQIFCQLVSTLSKEIKMLTSVVL